MLWLGCPENELTWESARALPSNLIDVYENGLMVESVVESKSAFGMVANTVIVKLKPEAIEPSMKRRRTEDTVTEDLEGFGTLI